MKHPFNPIISSNSRTLLIGTLPPENASYYFSNSSNTRLWDILKTIADDRNEVVSGTNVLPSADKEQILSILETGIYDIISEYDRVLMDSTKDQHVIPKSYSTILDLVREYQIKKLLFVYKNAAKWFLHSLTGEPPKKINNLKYKIEYGVFKTILTESGPLQCILLPSPLNRGKKGETLGFKLKAYRKEIIF